MNMPGLDEYVATSFCLLPQRINSGDLLRWWSGPMKWLVIFSVNVLIALALAVAEAEDSQPKSSPTSSKLEEPALPTPDATPDGAGPTLLPESDELPANPPPNHPMRASINQVAAKPSAIERARFEEAQSMAMSNPRAAYLLKRARMSSSGTARRIYLRAYYSTVAARMRKLDPELKSSIDAYEEAKVHQITGSGSPGNGSSHRSRSSHKATREVHHRSRKATANHRYERMMILYDPYGPYLPPW
jgi:hypothetical protein